MVLKREKIPGIHVIFILLRKDLSTEKYIFVLVDGSIFFSINENNIPVQRLQRKIPVDSQGIENFQNADC